jgi:hypothetical protein
MDQTPPPDDETTLVGMVTEVADLTAGLTTMLLPMLTISLPGIVLLFVVPVVLLALVVAVPAAIASLFLAPPYLLVRAMRRRRAGRAAAG